MSSYIFAICGAMLDQRKWVAAYVAPASAKARASGWFASRWSSVAASSRGSPVTTNATTVLVNDPFPGVLEVTVFPILDFARIRAAMLDVHYEDPANRYTRRQRVRLTPELTETVVRFSIRNPTLKRYRHELTIVRSDGTTEQRTVETEENILSIIG